MSFMAILVGGMILIVLSADYFTNGVEWLGYRLGLGEGAVGSLLAALGTALPETLVPIVAIVFGSRGNREAIGLGAILGAPFMLATLGFWVIGLGLWWSGRRRQGLTVGVPAMSGDLRFFLFAFGLAVLAGFVPGVWHPVVAGILVLGYLWHAAALLRHFGQDPEARAPEQALHLYRGANAPAWAVVTQVGMALFGLIVGARFFVMALGQVAQSVHLSGFLLSVIITPVATELPEVLNSVIWLRRHQDALAVGNVTGAMAFQASLVPAIGVVMTTWRFTPWELATAMLAWTAALFSYLRSRRGQLRFADLMTPGLFYVLFIALLLAGN
ncbi:MAG: sodium:calcium antiporter [Thermaerobacter sp.]|nr:sodium:calcium antiporter [Thermaerobacter sp.]